MIRTSILTGRTLLVATAIWMVPAAALAVSVQSSQGGGVSNVTTPGRNSWISSGSLLSYNGKPVYFSGKVVYFGNTDETCGRYNNKDVTSKNSQSYGGQCSGPIRADVADGAQYRICVNVNNAFDPCGAWSKTDPYN